MRIISEFFKSFASSPFKPRGKTIVYYIILILSFTLLTSAYAEEEFNQSSPTPLMTTVPMTTANWQNMYCGSSWSVTSDGLQVYGSGYRRSGVVKSKQIFDFTSNTDTYIKWKVNGNGTYMAFGFGTYIAQDGGTTAWSYGGSTVFSVDTWYYTHVRINSDKTYSVKISTGSYDDSGGTVYKSTSGTLDAPTWESARYSYIYGGIGDNYGSTGAYFVIGEAKTTATPVTKSGNSTTTYDFESSSTIPSDFTVQSGSWSIDTSTGYNSSKSLHIHATSTALITLNATNVVSVSFKMKTNLPDQYKGDVQVLAYNSTGAYNEYDSYWSQASDYSCWSDVKFYTSGSGSETIKIQIDSGMSGVDIETWIDNLAIETSNSLTVTKSGSGSGTVTADSGTLSWSGNTGTASYATNTVVNLTATPDSSSQFSSWTGCDSTSGANNNVCTVLMSASKNVTASFIGPGSTTYTLSVSKGTSSGTGTVTSSPAGISCGSTCSYSYASGTSVVLTAAADSGSTFTGWSGCDSSGGNYCTVAMTGTKSLTATFTGSCTSTYTLASSSATYTYAGGSGSVGVTASNTLCSWPVTANVSWITITSPATFTGNNTVTYSVAANTGTTSRTGTISIAGQTFTVTQTAQGYNTLTVTKAGSGSGTVSASTGTVTWNGNAGTAQYGSGTSLYLTATAASGSTFTSWTGCDNVSSTMCTVSMTSSKSVTATFSLNNSTTTHTLTVIKSGTGSGNVTPTSGTITWNGNTGTASYSASAQVTLTAAANSGAMFSSWSGCDSLYNSLCGLTMSADKTVTVSFKGSDIRKSKFDFDGDGNTDILWRNKTTGYNAAWLMNGTSLKSTKYLDTVSDTTWTIAGTGHFNQDSQTGIIWQNKMTGDTVTWFYNDNGSVMNSAAKLGTVSDVNWEIVAAGDTDSDNNTLVLWRHKTSGYNAKWKIKKSAMTSAVMLQTLSDSNWKIAGTGDFYGDGNIEILWRHAQYGYNALWHMNGDSVSSSEYLPTLADTDWEIVGTGDFNGDGITDIVWRHKTSYQVAIIQVI